MLEFANSNHGSQASVCLLTDDAIDLEKGEANVIGKGNLERAAFFTGRSLGSIKDYLSYAG